MRATPIRHGTSKDQIQVFNCWAIEVRTKVLEVFNQGSGRNQKSFFELKRAGSATTPTQKGGGAKKPIRPVSTPKIYDFWLRPGPRLQISRTLVRTSVALLWYAEVWRSLSWHGHTEGAQLLRDDDRKAPWYSARSAQSV